MKFFFLKIRLKFIRILIYINLKICFIGKMVLIIGIGNVKRDRNLLGYVGFLGKFFRWFWFLLYEFLFIVFVR